MGKGITALRIEASLVGHELLINDQPYESAQADSMVDETLMSKFTLEQQWALLSVLRKTMNKAAHVYQRTRDLQEGRATDEERRKRLKHENPMKRLRS